MTTPSEGWLRNAVRDDATSGRSPEPVAAALRDLAEALAANWATVNAGSPTARAPAVAGLHPRGSSD